MRKSALISLVELLCLLGFSFGAKAQFREDAFTQNYNDVKDTTSVKDTTGKLFSFKEWGRGMAHKQQIKIGTMFAPALLLPGTAQIYNKDYWKLPIVYGTIGGFLGVGGYYRAQYDKSVKAHKNWVSQNDLTIPEPFVNPKYKTLSTWMFVGAGVCYWATLLDGTICYDRSQKRLPGRATIYSILFPGLGQAYNGEYWKIPIYQGGIIASVYFWTTNSMNFNRFRNIYREATSKTGEYTGTVSAETAKYYRDVYRRYRDYSVLATALVYLLNVIDANVFAYMRDFEVSDDLSMQLSPTIITPDNAYAMSGRANVTDNAIGLRFGIRF